MQMFEVKEVTLLWDAVLFCLGWKNMTHEVKLLELLIIAFDSVYLISFD